MEEDKIISALIGLVGACSSNPKTANTDSVVIKALALPCLCRALSSECVSAVVDEIHAEKDAVAPDCAHCAAPCGNTSDYDMSRIQEAEEEIQRIKSELLSKIERLAAYIYERKVEIDTALFYKALAFFSYDMEREPLLDVIEEIENAERMITQEEPCFDSENHKN